MNEQWIQLKHLVGLEGLPKTIQGITQKAKSEKWARRRVQGVKGRIYEYQVSSLPETVLNNLNNSNTSIHDERIKCLNDRLQLALQNKHYTPEELAQQTEISLATIERYLSGKLMPSLEKLVMLADALQCPFEWLAIGNHATPPVENENKFVSLPKFKYTSMLEDIQSAYNEAQHIDNECFFSKSWLAKNGLADAHLATIDMQGDSMEPTISDGDTMLINIALQGWKGLTDGIFVLLIDEHLLIKRVQYDIIKKGYHLYSDNSIYQTFFISSDEQIQLKIIAKVEKVLKKPMK